MNKKLLLIGFALILLLVPVFAQETEFSKLECAELKDWVWDEDLLECVKVCPFPEQREKLVSFCEKGKLVSETKVLWFNPELNCQPEYRIEQEFEVNDVCLKCRDPVIVSSPKLVGCFAGRQLFEFKVSKERPLENQCYSYEAVGWEFGDDCTAGFIPISSVEGIGYWWIPIAVIVSIIFISILYLKNR